MIAQQQHICQQPPPYRSALVLLDSFGNILASLALLTCEMLMIPSSAAAAPARVAAENITTEDVTFESNGLTFHGTVLIPKAQNGSLPGMVIVGGAGPRKRDSYLAEATAFAAAGIVTLIYDKRTVGYSLTERSFAQLGDDALAGLELLRVRKNVNPKLVGLWGHSEGGWVVPLAATKSSSVGFVVVTGASALSPARVQTWSNCQHLMHSGFPERLCGAVGSNITRLLVAGGMFPEAGYDPIPTAKALDIPTLIVLAQFDQSTGPAESVKLFDTALAGNRLAKIIVIPDAAHNFRVSTNGFTRGADFAPGYFDSVTQWVRGLPETTATKLPAETTSDGFGGNLRKSAELIKLAWYESVLMHAIVFAAIISAFLSYPVTALVRRIRGRCGGAVGATPASIVWVAGLLAVFGTTIFLIFVMVTAATQPLGPVMFGRPLLWLALQILAIVTIGAGVWAGIVWFRERAQITRWAGVQLATLIGGTLLFMPWALYWGLLTP